MLNYEAICLNILVWCVDTAEISLHWSVADGWKSPALAHNAIIAFDKPAALSCEISVFSRVIRELQKGR